LVQTALGFADQVAVVVGTLPSEPIDGELRVRWVRELFSDATVVHLQDENPQHPEDDPDFWSIWKRSLLRVLPWPVDYVFAGEPYGARLAHELGAIFVPVPRADGVVPISATAVRASPFAQWSYLPDCVRQHYAKRIAIVGPESTGKSTLAKNLAQRFETLWVSEHARARIEQSPTVVESTEGLVSIARAQRASEAALARCCNRLLFCDTDALTTKIWTARLLGAAMAEQRELVTWAAQDRYALTLLCAPDVAWVADSVRYFADEGPRFFAAFEAELRAHNREYVVVSGSWEQRLATAVDAVLPLLE
jgi:NadR type nicotinamide-nucleotide adenylyltransferase